MIELIGSLLAIWLGILKTREHFIKHPIKRHKK